MTNKKREEYGLRLVVTLTKEQAKRVDEYAKTLRFSPTAAQIVQGVVAEFLDDLTKNPKGGTVAQ